MFANRFPTALSPHEESDAEKKHSIVRTVSPFQQRTARAQVVRFNPAFDAEPTVRAHIQNRRCRHNYCSGTPKIKRLTNLTSAERYVAADRAGIVPHQITAVPFTRPPTPDACGDRQSTRLNSLHIPFSRI